jgi:hypothetical protein
VAGPATAITPARHAVAAAIFAETTSARCTGK